jgi:hypothetical protein
VCKGSPPHPRPLSPEYRGEGRPRPPRCLVAQLSIGAQEAAVPPFEGTVIRRLGNANGRSAVELHAPAFSPDSDALARLRRVRVARQEARPAVDRHGDPLPRTHADKQSAVTLLLVCDNGYQMRPRSGARPLPTPAECRGGRSPVCSGPQRAC